MIKDLDVISEIPRQKNKIKRFILSEFLAWIFVGLGIVFFIISVIYLYTNAKFELKDAGSATGGLVVSLWSLAGVFFFYSTLQMQKKELRLQRREFKLQREEFSLTNKNLESQGRTFEAQLLVSQKQAAEGTFFKLLDNHRSLISSLTYGQGVGYTALGMMFDELKGNIDSYKRALDKRRYYKFDYLAYPQNIIYSRPDMFDMIDQICADAEFIMLLIKKSLDDLDSYHHILYNTLSIEERFIIGMVTNDLIIEKYSNIRFHNYRYTEYYLSSPSRYDEEREGAIPSLELSISNPDFSSRLKVVQKDTFPKLQFKNHESIPIRINGYDIAYNNSSNHKLRLSRNLAIEINPGERISIDIYDDISEIFITRIERETTYSMIPLKNFNSSSYVKFGFNIGSDKPSPILDFNLTLEAIINDGDGVKFTMRES